MKELLKTGRFNAVLLILCFSGNLIDAIQKDEKGWAIIILIALYACSRDFVDFNQAVKEQK